MVDSINKSDIERLLGRIGAFSFLEGPDLGVLAGLMVPRKVESGRILWLQGQEITHFYIVFYGQLRSVRCNVQGSKKLLSTLERGRHFGLAEMVTGATSAVTLAASKPSLLLCLDRKSLKRLLLDNAGICYRFMQTMARAIFSLTNELERASFEDSHTRLARILLRGQANPDRRLSHEDLAVRLAVSRETVSRALGDFKRRGLIETGYRSVAVLDRDGLMEYVSDYDPW